MPHTKSDDADRPCSRRVSFGSSRLQVVESIDKIAALVCKEHGLAPEVATTFSGSGYVSGCCEELLDALEAANQP